MKKTLLLLLLAVIGTTSLYALNQGDYVYTRSNRLKVTGDNLITNGDFSQGLATWTTAGGNALSADTFSIDESGPDGGKALTVLVKGDGRSGCSIVRSTPVVAGQTYYIMYKALSSSTTTTTVTNGSSCYENIFFNTDGSSQVNTAGYQAIATEKTYGADWTTISYAFTPSDNGYIVLNFNKLEGGEQFADFGIYAATKVGDDRILKEQITKARQMMADPRFPNGHDDYEGAVAMLEELLSIDDEQTVNDAVSEFSEATKAFLDANTVDVSSYLKYPGFDGAKHAYKVGNVGGADAWTCTGGRWMIMDAAEPFTSTYMDYQVGSGSNRLDDGEIYQTIDLPAGEYMYTMKGRAYKFKGRTSNIDYDADITGTWLFINGDTANCYPLDPERLKSYTVYGTVKDGETLKVGLHITGGQGHWYSFDDTELRLIGGTKEQVDAYINDKQLTANKAELKAVIDSATTILAEKEYLFDKGLMTDSLDKAKSIYDNSTDPTEVAQAVKALQSTIAGYYHTNLGYTNLYQDIAEVKAVLGDENLTADKSALRAALNAAETYFNALTDAGDDSANVAAHNTALLDAETAFYAQNASYATPGRVAIVNETFHNETYGWETDDLGNWRIGKSDAFTTGQRLYVWRGTSAHDSKYVWQKVNLPGSGLYELSAEVIALNENSSLDGDGTGVYLIAGDNRQQVHTKSAPETFKLRFTAGAGEMTVGLDARENALCNTISFSNVVLKYYGDADKYVRDSISSNVGPARDSLQAEITYANNLKNTSRNPLNVDITPFTTAISKAQNTLSTATTLDALYQAITDLKAAELSFKVSGVYPPQGQYFDVTDALTDADIDNDDWTMTGQQLGHEDEGYTLYYGKGVTFSSRVSQTVAKMPAGTYKVVAKATYRWSLPSKFDYDTYNSTAKQPMWLIGDDDSVKVRGILQGMNDEYVNDTLHLSLSDFRHGTNIWPLLEQGFYDNALVFDHNDASEPLEIAIGVYGIRQTSTVWIDGFQLYYYGDKENYTGIDDAREDEAATARTTGTYDLSGRRMPEGTTPSRGIYIRNGKKFIVR